MRELIKITRRIRDAAGRAYARQKVEQRNRIMRRETAEEVRQALQDAGWIQTLDSPAYD